MASYNVRDLKDDVAAAAGVVRAIAPDVLCLQEVPRHPFSGHRVAEFAAELRDDVVRSAPRQWRYDDPDLAARRRRHGPPRAAAGATAATGAGLRARLGVAAGAHGRRRRQRPPQPRRRRARPAHRRRSRHACPRRPARRRGRPQRGGGRPEAWSSPRRTSATGDRPGADLHGAPPPPPARRRSSPAARWRRSAPAGAPRPRPTSWRPRTTCPSGPTSTSRALRRPLRPA